MIIRKTKPNTSNEISRSIRKRVFVGLSGGVDSAVSAALLKQQGYDVTGVFIKVWSPDFLPCTWREERRDAMRVAAHLDIPFLFFDFEKEYKEGVADYMIEEYKAGRTPNPDVMCNREVKFGAFWKKAKEMGADYIATGHYAQIYPRGGLGLSKPSPWILAEGRDETKDQSYFLWTLTQDDLSHTLFPVGDLEKSEVRKLAQKFKLPVAAKKDSQGICFIGEVTLEEFLSEFVEAKPGNVLNTRGEVIGSHKGAIYFTIGERRGFDIRVKSPHDHAFYVVSKDMKKNTITVSNDQEEIKSLAPVSIRLKGLNFIREETDLSDISGRIRHRGQKKPVRLENINGETIVHFEEPVVGLSLGQSIVFYKGPECLGGAIMDQF